MFNDLGQSTKDRVARRVAELGGTLKPDQLKTALAELDRTFVTWRYVYEKTGAAVNLGALDGVLSVMDSITRS